MNVLFTIHHSPFTIHNYPMNNLQLPLPCKSHLIIVALQSEVPEYFLNLPHILFTGVGKVNASLQLAAKLGTYEGNYPFEYLLNLGTAGSHVFQVGETVQVGRFIQRDMDVQALGFAEFTTPFEDASHPLYPDYSIEGLRSASLYTGDSFVTDATLGYELVDMEGYALAKVAKHFRIPFASIKFITDNANQESSLAWEARLNLARDYFATCLDSRL